MRPAKRCLIGLVILVSLASTLAHADRLRRVRASTDNYFVDFRVRSGGVLGHTYIVYGRLNERGGISSGRYAGFYPDGPLSQTALLAVLAVPGKVSAERADEERAPRLIYRRRLSEAAFVRLARVVQSERRTPQVWDLLLNNCNSFAAYVARSIGLRVPPTFEFPTDFVRDLYVMNRPERSTRRHETTGRNGWRWTPPPSDRDTLYAFDAGAGGITAGR